MVGDCYNRNMARQTDVIYKLTDKNGCWNLITFTRFCEIVHAN